MKTHSVRHTCFVISFFVFGLTSSCNNSSVLFTAKQQELVRDSVQLMAESIAIDVSREGPVAWLRYFENTPGFFMASAGQLVFPNNDTATNFITTVLVKSISKIELRWSNLHIDPLADKLASLAAIFHEDITDTAGKKIPVDGYFTAIVRQTPEGWKLHNVHWSIIASH